MIKKYL